MIWQANHIDKHFPELDGIPSQQKKEIVEMARYQTYMKKGGRKKFVSPYVCYGVLGGATSVILGIIIAPFLPVEPVVVTITGTMSAVALASIQMQKHWMQQMRPKVQELAERYRTEEAYPPKLVLQTQQFCEYR